MYQRILVPIDGSEASKRGVREAVDLAKSQNSRLRFLHIVNEHVLESDYCLGTYAGNLVESMRKWGERVLSDADSVAKTAGVEYDSVMVESIGETAADAILRQALSWSANLIVMGTHGRRGLRRLAMGSDAESVVRQTAIPVLLVHHTPVVQPAAYPLISRDVNEAYVYA